MTLARIWRDAGTQGTMMVADHVLVADGVARSVVGRRGAARILTGDHMTIEKTLVREGPVASRDWNWNAPRIEKTLVRERLTTSRECSWNAPRKVGVPEEPANPHRD